jgi:hypothetical protein
MARRPARSIAASATVDFDGVEYEVTGNITPSTPPRPWAYHGEGDPGDPGEVEDIIIRNPDTQVELDFDALSADEQSLVVEALTVAAEEEAISRASDEDDRAYDAMRDARWER